MPDNNLYFKVYTILRKAVVSAMAELETALQEIDLLLGSDNILETEYEFQKRLEELSTVSRLFSDDIDSILYDDED